MGQPVKIVDLAEFRGLARPITLQPQYNLLVREIEWEIVPACESTGLGLIPWWLSAAARISAAGTPVTDSIASGELRSSATNVRPKSVSVGAE